MLYEVKYEEICKGTGYIEAESWQHAIQLIISHGHGHEDVEVLDKVETDYEISINSLQAELKPTP